jgi:hypothetical protein
VFGEIRIVSSPRIRSTRPLRPVRMLSPAFRPASWDSETCCTAPEAVNQTSPDDFRICQLAGSAKALELHTKKAGTRMRAARGIPGIEAIAHLLNYWAVVVLVSI